MVIHLHNKLLHFTPDLNLNVIANVEIAHNFFGQKILERIAFRRNGEDFKIMFIGFYYLEHGVGVYFARRIVESDLISLEYPLREGK